MFCTGKGHMRAPTHSCKVGEVMLLAFHERCRHVKQIATCELQWKAWPISPSLLQPLE